MNILVTGSAGFIGANLVLRLLESTNPIKIIGLDNLNHYYDPSLKDYRLGLIDEKVKCCIGISKLDWDAHETSWDFQTNPIVDLSNQIVATIDIIF